jgi:RNA polymerase sigma-70 factor (ECF subfamily)
VPPTEVQYDFLPEVREELLRTRSRRDIVNVLETLRELTPAARTPFGPMDIRALAATAREQSLAEPGVRAFAHVAELVLGGLGGRFGEMADRIGAALAASAATELTLANAAPATGSQFRATRQPAGASKANDLTLAKQFEQIYRDHYDRIWRYVRFKGAGLETDDIVTDVFITALAKLEEIPKDKVGAWLYVVAQNKIRNAVREKGMRPPVLSAREGTHDTRVVEDPAFAVLERLSFEAAVNFLDDVLDREILYLIGHEGLRPTDIAKILGLSRSALSMRMRRMQDKLAAFRQAPSSLPQNASDEPE